MKKTVCIMLVVSLLIFNTLCASALTEGDWEYKILDNEITIIRYMGDEKNVVVPDTIRGCPVVAMNIITGPTIETLQLPETIREIGNDDSDNLSNSAKQQASHGARMMLRQINIPKSLKVIKDRTFQACGNLEVALDLSNVEKIGEGCFNGCGAEKIILSNNITYIPENAFWGSAIKTIEIPNTVQRIDRSAFGANNFETVIVPGSVKTIATAAFSYSDTLETVIFSYGVETLEKKQKRGDNPVLSYCTNLESVYIPDTVTEMDSDLLMNSPNAIVYCSENSYAAKFCKENGISYLIDNSVNSKIHVMYNGERISFHKYNQNPEIVNGRTLVPLRSIFEALGATVEWEDSTQTVTAKKGTTTVSLQIGSAQMNVNGTAKTLDVPATLMNGRTMVPVRAISEAFGCNVQWSGNTQTVTLTD